MTDRMEPTLTRNPADYEAPKTLRDEFAMAALTGLIAHPTNRGTALGISALAYDIADAMMEARK